MSRGEDAQSVVATPTSGQQKRSEEGFPRAAQALGLLRPSSSSVWSVSGARPTARGAALPPSTRSQLLVAETPRAVPSGPPRFPPPLPLYPAPPPGPLQVWLPLSSLPGPPARHLLPALPPPLATGTSRERKAAQRAGVSHASLGAGGRLGAARAPAGQKSRLAQLRWWLAASPQPSLWIERWGWTPSPAVLSVGCWSRSRRAVWSTWGRGLTGGAPRPGPRVWDAGPGQSLLSGPAPRGWTCVLKGTRGTRNATRQSPVASPGVTDSRHRPSAGFLPFRLTRRKSKC